MSPDGFNPDAGLDNVTIVGGVLPPEWGNMTRLRSLSLNFSAAARQATTPAVSLPTNWSGLASLERLSLSNWVITGSPPSTWSSLTSLKEFTLRNVTLCCGAGLVLPASWGGLPALTRLVLDNVKGLSGDLPNTWVTGLTNLTLLQLKGVPGVAVATADMVALMNASRASGGLQSLALEGFNLSGALPPVSSR
jgi:hypothetical protein